MLNLLQASSRDIGLSLKLQKCFAICPKSNFSNYELNFVSYFEYSEVCSEIFRSIMLNLMLWAGPRDIGFSIKLQKCFAICLKSNFSNCELNFVSYFGYSEVYSEVFRIIMLNLVLLTVGRFNRYWLPQKTSEMFCRLS